MPPQEAQEARFDGTVSAGTWRKYKVMKERKLPPIPEENSCVTGQIGILLWHKFCKQDNLSDTPSSGDYRGFHEDYNISLEHFDTHLYAEIDGMRECNYPDLVQDYVNMPFDTTLHRERTMISNEENIEPYSITSFCDVSMDNRR